MKIQVNGTEHEVTAGTTLAELVASLELKTDRIAAERNLKVVPKAEHGSTVLEDGDRIEIVTFVGGG
jgi:sulfur carrier protein